MENINTIKAIVTVVAAFLSALLGTLYIPVLLMILCNIIDYATGLMQQRTDRTEVSVLIAVSKGSRKRYLCGCS